VIALVLPAAGCTVEPAARASDTWTRSLPLAEGGEVRVTNVSGRVEFQGIDGAGVEIRAEKIARAATEQAARDLLPRIVVKERVTPDLVSIETVRIAGLLIGVSYEVHYVVRVPRRARVRAVTANGVVVVSDIDGRVVAQTTNGGIRATGIGGGIEARSVNGRVDVQVAALGDDPILLTGINGEVRLALPESAAATVTATTVNGTVVRSGLNFDVVDESRRRFEGRLNGGGLPITLGVTNGRIAIRSVAAAVAEAADQ
jgi:hypothetical protein